MENHPTKQRLEGNQGVAARGITHRGRPPCVLQGLGTRKRELLCLDTHGAEILQRSHTGSHPEAIVRHLLEPVPQRWMGKEIGNRTIWSRPRGLCLCLPLWVIPHENLEIRTGRLPQGKAFQIGLRQDADMVQLHAGRRKNCRRTLELANSLLSPMVDRNGRTIRVEGSARTRLHGERKQRKRMVCRQTQRILRLDLPWTPQPDLERIRERGAERLRRWHDLPDPDSGQGTRDSLDSQRPVRQANGPFTVAELSLAHGCRNLCRRTPADLRRQRTFRCKACRESSQQFGRP